MILSIFVEIISKRTSIHKSTNILITQITCGRIAWNFAEIMPDILQSTTDGDDISYGLGNMQKLCSLHKFYKNHILYGCHGNKYGQSNLYLSKWYNLDIKCHLWCFKKDIKTLIFFTAFSKAYSEGYTSAFWVEYLDTYQPHMVSMLKTKLESSIETYSE